MPGWQLKKNSVKSPSQVSEVDCCKIQSPSAFGLFDLGINRDINQRSSLYQELSKVKVILEFNTVCIIHFFP
jgi:hypothetical protein